MPRSSPTYRFIAVFVLIFAGSAFFADATRGGENKLTLVQAVRLSLATPRILAAHEAVIQARADAQSASLIPNPSLGVETGMLPLSRPYTIEEPGGPPELSGWISYPVDWFLFGKRSAVLMAADSAVSLAEAEYAEIVRQQVAVTTEAFYTVLEAEALLEAAKQARKDLKQAELVIRKAAANGGRPQVELSRARLELQSAKREERSARSDVVIAKAKLQAMLGHEGDAASLQVVGSLYAALKVKPLPVEAAFAVASENRPDIVAIRKKVAKMKSDEVVESRNAWPEISVSFGLAHQFQRSIGAADVTAYGFSLELSLPFFNRNQGDRARAASASVQTNFELMAALSNLHAEIEQAVQSLSTAFKNATEMSQTDLDLATKVRDSFKKAYAAGGRPLIEMLDAQRSYLETYRAYIYTRAEYWRALSQYEAAIGKKVSP